MATDNSKVVALRTESPPAENGAAKSCQAGLRQLKQVAPTDEEIAAINAKLKAMSPEEQRKMKANLAYFLRSRNQEDANMKGVRGEERRAWLENYMVMKLRQKDSKSTSVTQHRFKNVDFKEDGWQWMAKFQLLKEFGPAKGQVYLDKCKFRACSMSGSLDEDLKEYRVPISKEALQEFNEFMDSTVAETEVKDADKQEKLDNQSAIHVSMHGGQPANVKIEAAALTPLELKIAKIRENPKGAVGAIQAMALEAATLIEDGTDNKYTTAVVDDLKKLKNRMARIEKGLQCLAVTKKEPERKGVEKLATDLSRVEAEYKTAKSWAIKLGLKGFQGKKRRAKVE